MGFVRSYIDGIDSQVLAIPDPFYRVFFFKMNPTGILMSHLYSPKFTGRISGPEFEIAAVNIHFRECSVLVRNVMAR